MKRLTIACSFFSVVWLAASTASAFCGFYVSHADSRLYNNATMASLMRDGQRTVLSMQNNYEGPPEDFAMVVPVPMVLEKDDVRTLPDGLFESLDALTAPRLVEYWEQDPCRNAGKEVAAAEYEEGAEMAMKGAGDMAAEGAGEVRVEAEFEVDEYDIVILSADQSTALESWLRENDYNIPENAAPFMAPYVQKGQYFFVAKVDIDEVEYVDGEAVLSPLRFHYDSEDFVLPVRLGLINSKGAQDLIAFVLAKDQRYEVANLPNVGIPTNLAVEPETKQNFGGFYRELFDTVIRETPQAVVTEYAWATSGCDPCTGPPLTWRQLLLLGGDALGEPGTEGAQSFSRRGWVVTRLHTRYGKDSLGEDLVFEPAAPIAGGNGTPQGKDGTLENQFARSAKSNRFQGRYVIRHFWDGRVLKCEYPSFGDWSNRKGFDHAKPTPARGVGFESVENQRPLSTYLTGQSRVPGLEGEVDDYDDPISDVVAGWKERESAPASGPPPAAGVIESSASYEATEWDDVDRPLVVSCAGCGSDRPGSGGCGGSEKALGFVALLGLGALLRARRRT